VPIEPIFAGGQLPASVITTQQFLRGVNDSAPIQVAQGLQVQSLIRESDQAAEDAAVVVSDVDSTPTYDIHARVEPTPGDGRRRGQLFDSRA
jgi:hypothetical protein